MALSRRDVGMALAAVAALALPGLGRADEAIDLEWEDLLPRDGAALAEALDDVWGDTLGGGTGTGISHDPGAAAAAQPASTGLRHDYDGQIVRLSGFIVPIDYKGAGLTAFMLVPYVGACIHVPPPPANQLVLVTTERPYISDGLFAPVTVTGMFGAASRTTALAEIGYALSADRISPYDG